MDPEEPEDGGLEISEIPHGRRLTPVGDIYRTTQKNIDNMTDPELDAHIAKLKALVREAETSLDFRRVKLVQATGEHEFRLNKIRRNWRAATIGRVDPITKTSAGIKISTAGNGGAPTLSPKMKAFIDKLYAKGHTTSEVEAILKGLFAMMGSLDK